MPKSVTFNRGLSSVLFWSVISAAFIGPGTVTTASNAGATFGLDLLWALVFSIFATIILQEAAARVTIASGMNLGEILARRYERNSRWVRWILFGTIVFGCAAYQAGNILGAISGLGLFSEIPRQWLTLVLCLLAAVLLWWGNTAWITRILGAAVALMGIAFIWSAFSGNLGFGAWLEGMRPRVNNGNALLVIGLIGTTIVPYNLFLASGISKGQRIQEMRWGVVIAIIIGGIISAAIMAVGTQVNGPFQFHGAIPGNGIKNGGIGYCSIWIRLVRGGVEFGDNQSVCSSHNGSKPPGFRPGSMVFQGKILSPDLGGCNLSRPDFGYTRRQTRTCNNSRPGRQWRIIAGSCRVSYAGCQ